MELPVSRQLLEAALSLLLGLAAGFLYDFFRVIRRRTHSELITGFTDLLFWVITGVALFLLGLSVGQGGGRLFMTTLTALGGVLYFCTLSRFAIILCDKLADLIALLFKTVSYPFVLLYRMLKIIAETVKNVFQYGRKWYTIGETDTPRPRVRDNLRRGAGEGDTNETETIRYNYENSSVRLDHLRRREPVEPARQNRRRAR